MKSIAAITILAGSAAAFAPVPVSRVESSLGVASELSSMSGISLETGGKVVCSRSMDYLPIEVELFFVVLDSILTRLPTFDTPRNVSLTP
jgi:hypothetical protein